jgi:glycerol-3-phosphate dehydrogenase (NAD(P)+)
MSAAYPVGVIGAGAWGTALAALAAGVHGKALVWSRNESVVSAINGSHSNPLYLPDCALHPDIRATQNMADMAQCGILLVVTPSQHLRTTLAQLPETSAPLVLCCKGIEADSGKLMIDVAADIRPHNPLAILSGPTFAHEVAAGKPTAITLACSNKALGDQIAQAIAAPHFRPYWTDDVIGAEIGGAVKNVLAIGCGVVDGAGLGLNARAALIARGFAEMQRFGLAKGARAETLSGLSGLGDLVLTCSSESSRNFSLGRGLGQGQNASTLLANKHSVAEGAATAPVLLRSAQDLGVDMPITAAVNALLNGELPVMEAIQRLLSRPLKAEG